MTAKPKTLLEIYTGEKPMKAIDLYLETLTKDEDITYRVYQKYIQLLLEDSGDMGELPQIKDIASRLTLANAMHTKAYDS